jgi:hypothetical protein
VTTTPQSVRDLLNADEISAIENAPLIAGARHPTWYPIFRQPQHRLDFDNNRSVALVRGQANGIDWLHRQQPMLTAIDDPEGAAAALTEIRAYAALVEAGFTTAPILRAGSPTPDFGIDAGDGIVDVEVFAKHQDDDQKDMLADPPRGIPPDVERSDRRPRQVLFTETELHPGGAPDPAKPHDSTQANMISRVCAAKGKEAQVRDDRPSLLWIDFRSFGIWPQVLALDQAAPLISGNHGLTSGALWYAFYGWRGAPIFEEDFFPMDRVVPMGHDGRFRLSGKKKSKLSGALLVLEDGQILFENPWANQPLPARARRLCERLPNFDLGRAICSWSPGDAEMLVEIGRRQIEAMRHWRDAWTNG